MKITHTPPNQAPVALRSKAISSQDEQNLKALAEADMLHLSRDAHDSDDYGRPLNAFEARQLLDRGQPLVVTHPGLGSFEKARLPENSGKWYVGKVVDPEIKKANLQRALRNNVEREGAFISDFQQLNRYLEANGLSPSGQVLTPEESQASKTLQKYQGSITGQFTTVYDEDDFNLGYYFKTVPDRSDKNDGLYDPNTRKGGFLSIGSREDRLTPYEALNLLHQQKPVHIVKNGQRVAVSSFDELQTYDRLS